MKMISRVLMIIFLLLYMANLNICHEGKIVFTEEDVEVPLFPHNEHWRTFDKEKDNIWIFVRDMGFWEVPQSEVYNSSQEAISWLKETYERRRMEEFWYNLNLLAHLIHGEAEGENFRCKLGVGNVALNRIKSYRFEGDTLEEVIYAPGQYACTWDGRFELEPNAESWEAARWLLKGRRIFPDNALFQAQFGQGDGLYERIGVTYFCYLNDY